jgi:glutaredoxin
MLFKVYGKPDCPFCTKAVQILQDNNIPYQYYSIGDHITKEELEEMLGMTVKSVPVILNGIRYVGGYEQLCDYLIEEDLV